MVDDSELSTLLSSATLVMIGGVIGAGSKLLERVIIGRALSPEAYGDVSVGLAVMTFSTTIAMVGLSQGVPRYLSRYENDRDRRGIWLTGLGITVVFAVVLAVVFATFVEEIVGTLFENPDSTQLLYLFIAATPFVVAQKIAIGGIRGHENTLYRTYTKDLLYPLGRISALAGLLALGYGIIAAGYAYLVAAITTCLIAHYLLHELVPLIGPFRTHAREMLAFSIPLVLSTVINVLLFRTDTLMIAYFRSSFEVGQYNAAYPIASGMLVLLAAFGFLYLPMASRLDANDKRAEIDMIYTTTTKWVYIVTFPAFLTFVLFPGDVMAIFFGADYSEAARALPILAAGFFTSAAVGRNRETLSALGETNYILIANAAGLFLNVILNLLLIPQFGFVGAAVTSAFTFALVHGVVCGVLWYRHDITPVSSTSIRTLVVLPLALLPPAAVLSTQITLSVVTLFPFLFIVGILGIATVAVAGGLQPEDRVAIEFIEDAIGFRVPLVRRYIPEE